MVKKIFKPIIFDIFSKKEQIATARTNSHGQAQIATACGGPLPVGSYDTGRWTVVNVWTDTVQY
jgi:hypothetical protein